MILTKNKFLLVDGRIEIRIRTIITDPDPGVSKPRVADLEH
jgi:hypothetical protein